MMRRFVTTIIINMAIMMSMSAHSASLNPSLYMAYDQLLILTHATGEPKDFTHAYHYDTQELGFAYIAPMTLEITDKTLFVRYFLIKDSQSGKVLLSDETNGSSTRNEAIYAHFAQQVLPKVASALGSQARIESHVIDKDKAISATTMEYLDPLTQSVAGVYDYVYTPKTMLIAGHGAERTPMHWQNGSWFWYHANGHVIQHARFKAMDNTGAHQVLNLQSFDPTGELTINLNTLIDKHSPLRVHVDELVNYQNFCRSTQGILLVDKDNNSIVKNRAAAVAISLGAKASRGCVYSINAIASPTERVSQVYVAPSSP